ncbi:MAG TPA: 50S ribosomal protein L11 methyltransferase [Hanamia sp.]|jgi:ribosomal protein L11 methyltransferase|nr:50S ribosomal protein L11 methyltransferase [Hanamia sp.]
MNKKNYIKIEIKTASTDEAEMLIAALSEINFYAFEQENNLLNAYVNEEDFNIQKLKEILPEGTFFTKDIIEEENWNEQWESGIEPVVVNEFAAIRPSFSKPINNVKFDLLITPKMSFGTGHHATTFLMVELMQQMNFENKTVVDFGTGTAVLAILAEKCGASKVIAVDYDEWSIENAKENIEVNHCKNITLKHQNDLSALDPADVILANINLNVLRNESSSISSLLKPGSLLLVSGFLFSDEKEIENIFEEKNLVKRKIKQRGEWLAILFEKP